MRVFAVLAFTVASVAALSGCASDCTQNILNSCTPRFQFELSTGDGTACFLLDLAPPFVRLLQSEDSTCGDLADFDGEVVASTTNYTIVDNSLTLTTTGTPCPDGLKFTTAEIVLTFVYSSFKQAPVLCGTICTAPQKLKVYTNAEECVPQPKEQPKEEDNDNDVAGTWGGSSNGGSGRRNSASGRRNSASSRRNSASSNGNDGTRRAGCAEVAMYNLNRTATCQLGQCCGSNFCRRDYGVGDCWAANSAAQWLVGHQCEDETCNPNQGDQPGAGSGKGGAIVIIHSSLDNAVGALPERGRLLVATKSVEGEIPAFGNEILIAFDVERQFDNETLISGYLPNGGFIIVTVEVDFLNGQEITVLRWDEATSTYVDTLEDCKENGAGDKEITYADGVYSVPICHTSSFIVAFGADGKDKKDHKHDKATKNTKKTKPAKVPTAGKTALKAPKAKDTKKEGKKGGKTAIAIGVGVAGGAVALVGAGVFLKSRRNKNKKPTAGAAPKATAEVAVVSV